LEYKNERHSTFAMHSVKDFYGLLGSKGEAVKKICIRIPINNSQYNRLDSIMDRYLDSVPYDYAFLGFRCASSTYEILHKVGIMPKSRFPGVKWRIFY